MHGESLKNFSYYSASRQHNYVKIQGQAHLLSG
jgi:hypothetical protein